MATPREHAHAVTVMPTPGEYAHPLALAAADKPETVVLDLVGPLRSGQHMSWLHFDCTTTGMLDSLAKTRQRRLIGTQS